MKFIRLIEIFVDFKNEQEIIRKPFSQSKSYNTQKRKKKSCCNIKQ